MEISLITTNISAEFLTPAGVPPWAEPTLIALQEVTPDQLAYLQGELSEFASLTVPVVDHDPAMTAVWPFLIRHLFAPNLRPAKPLPALWLRRLIALKPGLAAFCLPAPNGAVFPG
jgi:hypothetical protein